MMRHLLSFLLCAVLVVTSHSAGAARGADRAVDHMVVCAGASTFVIYVAADGAPTPVPHGCPDCVLLGLVGSATQVPGCGVGLVVVPFAARAVSQPVPVPAREDALARAPPRLI